MCSLLSQSTTIPQDGNVRLLIYNSMGKVVTELVNTKKEAGSYTVNFEAGELPGGMYFYRIEAGNFMEINKMLLVK